MRKLCAAPAEAFGTPYTECYETGVANLGSQCLDVYDSCVETCQEALMSLGGAGGAGGASDAGGDGGTSPLPQAGEGGARQ